MSTAKPVIEYLVRGKKTWGTRISPGGEAEEYTEATGGWEHLVQLEGDALFSLLELARGGGFFALPARLGDAQHADDGTTLTWRIHLGGRSHEVIAHGREGSANPVLRALNDEVQRVVGEALNRSAG